MKRKRWKPAGAVYEENAGVCGEMRMKSKRREPAELHVKT